MTLFVGRDVEGSQGFTSSFGVSSVGLWAVEVVLGALATIGCSISGAMNRLNRQQKERVQQFVSIAGTTDKVAVAALKAAEWNLEAAFEVYYNSNLGVAPAPPVPATSQRQLDELFLRYGDPQEGMVMADGVARFCEDLQVDPQDVVTLVLSWHMRAATMCEFTRDEFVGGLLSLGADSIEKLKQLLPGLRSELRDEGKFRDIYEFAFNWAKEKGQKSLALDTAVGMWTLLFRQRNWPLVDAWCQFLLTNHNKAISKDTWTQLLEFSRLDPALAKFDDEGAWPYLIDEFVEHLRETGQVPSRRA